MACGLILFYSPAVEEKVVLALLDAAAFRSDAGFTYIHLTNAALKVSSAQVFRHLASLTCIQRVIPVALLKHFTSCNRTFVPEERRN